MNEPELKVSISFLNYSKIENLSPLWIPREIIVCSLKNGAMKIWTVSHLGILFHLLPLPITALPKPSTTATCCHNPPPQLDGSFVLSLVKVTLVFGLGKWLL